MATASFVCKVENTIWPVKAAWKAMSAVSLSRISPTRTTSGSWRRTERSTEANDMPDFSLTWTWLIPSSRYSMGSSTVTMLMSSDLSR